MKQFMKTNKITYNLMSFTGFKSMLIFSLLVESPKSYDELKYYLENHEYLHESVSTDTLRIYLNSLRHIGCKIRRISKGGISKYTIDSHPFELKINDEQTKSILKIFKTISKSIEISDLLSLQEFFDKFSNYITNEDLKLKLKNISPLNNIDPQIIKDLKSYAHNNTEIIILYNSLNSGKKNINIIVDKLEINNGKLYVYGMNSEHKHYSSLLVSRIIKIIGINFQQSELTAPEITVTYELKNNNGNQDFELLNCETIIENHKNKTIIQINSRNKFDIMQRIMSLSPNCKVLTPESFRTDIIDFLKQMKEGYLEKI
ncbi:WYL domain-containing protein [bacterium]|nr:WYL domain-containing protein [bacterium]